MYFEFVFYILSLYGVRLLVIRYGSSGEAVMAYNMHTSKIRGENIGSEKGRKNK
jgi:hypothetical protein